MICLRKAFVTGLFFLGLVSVLPRAQAQDITIFDVRSSLSMGIQDKTFKDFYLNKGSESGLKVGMIITVVRKVPLYDSYLNRSAGDLQIEVGRLKIIHVQNGLAVGRDFEELSRETRPLLEDNFIMVGDRLDLGSATGEKKAKSTAELSPPSSEPSAAPKPSLSRPGEFSVDFASKAKDKAPMESSVQGPVLQ